MSKSAVFTESMYIERYKYTKMYKMYKKCIQSYHNSWIKLFNGEMHNICLNHRFNVGCNARTGAMRV